MKHLTQTIKTFLTGQRRDVMIGVSFVAGVVLLAIITFLFVQNSTPKVIYQPADACKLFSLAEAQELLGSRALNSTATNPAQTGNTTTSQCGYSDGVNTVNNLVIAAVVVRSGVNDKGVEQNKTEFNAGKPTTDVEDVPNLGKSAYFNQKLGQLNILTKHNWIILSYGIGSAPELNELDKAIELAHKVL